MDETKRKANVRRNEKFENFPSRQPERGVRSSLGQNTATSSHGLKIVPDRILRMKTAISNPRSFPHAVVGTSRVFSAIHFDHDPLFFWISNLMILNRVASRFRYFRDISERPDSPRVVRCLESG